MDEEKWGLEYDLDVLRIAVTPDFNMGAMENKGLMIFNSSFLLGNEATATDRTLKLIISCIAHEYFHNWTGNRVTLRDWFQIALKEGFTMFRDNKFSAENFCKAIERIDVVSKLKIRQFPEDAGPFRHPVVPKELDSMDDAYSWTVYLKGQEVFNVLFNILGWEQFRKGADLYFERFDGQAAVIEDLVTCMEEANGVDLSKFSNWLHYAGTPRVEVKKVDSSDSGFTLSFRQLPPEGAEEDVPFFHVPVKMAFIGKESGEPLNVEVSYKTEEGEEELEVIEGEFTVPLKEQEGLLHVRGVTEEAVPSLFRMFSAPVLWSYPYAKEEYIHLVQNDTDLFNRYEAAQRLHTEQILGAIRALKEQRPLTFDHEVIGAITTAVADISIDPALRARLLQLPSFKEISSSVEGFPVEEYEQAIDDYKKSFSVNNLLKNLYEQVRGRLESAPIEEEQVLSLEAFDRRSADRSLSNALLTLLFDPNRSNWREEVERAYGASHSFTEKIHALSLLLNCSEGDERERVTTLYREEFKENQICLNEYFRAEAAAKREGVYDRVGQIETDEKFLSTNPDCIKDTFSGFVSNLRAFHDSEGRGYQTLANEIIRCDEFNAHLAACLMDNFEDFPKLDRFRQEKMYNQLLLIQSSCQSPDVLGRVEKLLQTPLLAFDIT